MFTVQFVFHHITINKRAESKQNYNIWALKLISNTSTVMLEQYHILSNTTQPEGFDADNILNNIDSHQ